MTRKQGLAELKKAGTARNGKTYKRHGAGDGSFAVSVADLGRRQKRIKVDHELGPSMRETGKCSVASNTIPGRIVLPGATVE